MNTEQQYLRPMTQEPTEFPVVLVFIDDTTKTADNLVEFKNMADLGACGSILIKGHFPIRVPPALPVKTQDDLDEEAYEKWIESDESPRDTEDTSLAFQAGVAYERARVADGIRELESQHREMRTLLLRIHSARVGMNEAAVIVALNDVDAFFREPNAN